MFANEFVLANGERYVMNRIDDDSVQQPEVPLPEDGRFVATPAANPLAERLSGVWLWRSAGAHDVFNRGGLSPMPLNEAGLAARAAYDPLNTPAMNCVSPNFPAMLYAPYLIREGNGRGTDIPGSAQKRLREEYTVSEDARYLHLNLTVEDSVYLTEPYHSTRVWERAAEDTKFEPFACDLEAARRSSRNAVR